MFIFMRVSLSLLLFTKTLVKFYLLGSFPPKLLNVYNSVTSLGKPSIVLILFRPKKYRLLLVKVRDVFCVSLFREKSSLTCLLSEIYLQCGITLHVNDVSGE